MLFVKYILSTMRIFVGHTSMLIKLVIFSVLDDISFYGDILVDRFSSSFFLADNLRINL